MVSVIIPCRNEIRFIEKCLNSVFIADRVPGGIEIIVVDGMSEDGTRDVVNSFKAIHSNLFFLDNPDKITPSALNIGIKIAKGDYIIRLDAHSIYPSNYFNKCIETIKSTGADNVGGALITKQNGNTFGAKCVQTITTHRFGVGNSEFRVETQGGWVDTVPFGCFKKEVFTKYGYFDVRLIRNQDFELNQRIIKEGGKIWLNPEIKIFYFNQSTLRGLFRQAFNTSQWNSIMWYLAPYSFRLRHSFPGIFLLIIIAILFSSYISFIGLKVLSITTVLYLCIDLFVAFTQSRKLGWKLLVALIVSFPFYHFLYGLGTIYGALRVLFPFSQLSSK